MMKLKTTTPIFNLIAIFCVLFSLQGKAQVTIGSLIEARSTTLLDLKENDSDENNSKRGFLFPRVELQQHDMLYPMYSNSLDYLSNKDLVDGKHTGLTVYNVTSDQTFSEGTYQWDGEKWMQVVGYGLSPVATGDIDCQNISLYPELYEAGKPYKGILVVPYYNGNGGYYMSGTVTNNNNFTIRLRPGKLNVGYGELYFEVTSNSPLFSSPAKTKINIYNLLGNTVSCQDILIGGDERGKTSIYYKKTGRIHSDAGGRTWDATYHVFNHLRIGYRKNITTERIQWGTTQHINVTYYWLKSGEGGLDFWSYGQVKSKGHTAWLSELSDFASGSSTSEGGPSGNKPNMRNANRDIGQVWMVFHHPDFEEVYRITVNAHEKLGATERGYVTFFTEFMD